MPDPKQRFRVALSVVVYAVLILLGLQVFPLLLVPLFGYLLGGTMSAFVAAAVANTATVRIFGIPGAPHRRPELADIGLGWGAASVRNLGLGAAGGIGAALLVLAPPILAGNARFQATPDSPGSLGAALFLVIVLIFGAVSEEMLFRGYGFQMLVGTLGRFATILPSAALFGFLHGKNQGFSSLGFLNTCLWGIVFGYAVVRSRDLWLASGLHFGWNVMLPIFGASLSGFKMGVTGYALVWDAPGFVSGGAYGPEGSIITSVVAAAAFAYVMKAPVHPQQAPLLGPEED